MPDKRSSRRRSIGGRRMRKPLLELLEDRRLLAFCDYSGDRFPSDDLPDGSQSDWSNSLYAPSPSSTTAEVSNGKLRIVDSGTPVPPFGSRISGDFVEFTCFSFDGEITPKKMLMMQAEVALEHLGLDSKPTAEFGFHDDAFRYAAAFSLVGGLPSVSLSIDDVLVPGSTLTVPDPQSFHRFVLERDADGIQLVVTDLSGNKSGQFDLPFASPLFPTSRHSSGPRAFFGAPNMTPITGASTTIWDSIALTIADDPGAGVKALTKFIPNEAEGTVPDSPASSVNLLHDEWIANLDEGSATFASPSSLLLDASGHVMYGRHEPYLVAGTAATIDVQLEIPRNLAGELELPLFSQLGSTQPAVYFGLDNGTTQAAVDLGRIDDELFVTFHCPSNGCSSTIAPIPLSHADDVYQFRLQIDPAGVVQLLLYDDQEADYQTILSATAADLPDVLDSRPFETVKCVPIAGEEGACQYVTGDSFFFGSFGRGTDEKSRSIWHKVEYVVGPIPGEERAVKSLVTYVPRELPETSALPWRSVPAVPEVPISTNGQELRVSDAGGAVRSRLFVRNEPTLAPNEKAVLEARLRFERTATGNLALGGGDGSGLNAPVVFGFDDGEHLIAVTAVEMGGQVFLSLACPDVDCRNIGGFVLDSPDSPHTLQLVKNGRGKITLKLFDETSLRLVTRVTANETDLPTSRSAELGGAAFFFGSASPDTNAMSSTDWQHVAYIVGQTDFQIPTLNAGQFASIELLRGEGEAEGGSGEGGPLVLGPGSLLTVHVRTSAATRASDLNVYLRYSDGTPGLFSTFEDKIDTEFFFTTPVYASDPDGPAVVTIEGKDFTGQVLATETREFIIGTNAANPGAVPRIRVAGQSLAPDATLGACAPTIRNCLGILNTFYNRSQSEIVLEATPGKNADLVRLYPISRLPYGMEIRNSTDSTARMAEGNPAQLRIVFQPDSLQTLPNSSIYFVGIDGSGASALYALGFKELARPRLDLMVSHTLVQTTITRPDFAETIYIYTDGNLQGVEVWCKTPSGEIVQVAPVTRFSSAPDGTAMSAEFHFQRGREPAGKYEFWSIATTRRGTLVASDSVFVIHERLSVETQNSQASLSGATTGSQLSSSDDGATLKPRVGDMIVFANGKSGIVAAGAGGIVAVGAGGTIVAPGAGGNIVAAGAGIVGAGAGIVGAGAGIVGAGAGHGFSMYQYPFGIVGAGAGIVAAGAGIVGAGAGIVGAGAGIVAAGAGGLVPTAASRVFVANSIVAAGAGTFSTPLPNGIHVNIVAAGAGGLSVMIGQAKAAIIAAGAGIVAAGAGGLTPRGLAMQLRNDVGRTATSILANKGMSFAPRGPGEGEPSMAGTIAPADGEGSVTIASEPEAAALDAILYAHFQSWHDQLLANVSPVNDGLGSRHTYAAQALDVASRLLDSGFSGLSSQHSQALNRASDLLRFDVAPAVAGQAVTAGSRVVLTPANGYSGWHVEERGSTVGQPLPVTLAGIVATIGSELETPSQLGQQVIPLPLSGELAHLVTVATDRIELQLPDHLVPGVPQLLVLTTEDGRIGMANLVLASATGTLEFSQPQFVASEAGLVAEVLVTRSGGTAGALGAVVRTRSGGTSSATPNEDFEPVSIVVAFGHEDSRPRAIRIPLRADQLVEGDETLVVELVDPTGGAILGANSTAEVVIRDVGGAIRGHSFLDIDSDGQRGAAEPAVVGQTIFVDSNGDGVLNDSGQNGVCSLTSLEPCATTDSAGEYVLTGLPAGVHHIHAVAPESMRQILPASGHHEVAMDDASSAVDGVDFAWRDEQAPRWLSVRDLRVLANSRSGAAVSFGELQVIEDGGRRATVTCSHDAGIFSMGTHSVECQAQDASGNTARVAFAVVVVSPWQNATSKYDVSNDGHVVPLDALQVINELNTRAVSNARGELPLPAMSVSRYYDVTGDAIVAPLDVLQLINFLNQQGSAEGESSEKVEVLFFAGDTLRSLPLTRQTRSTASPSRVVNADIVPHSEPSPDPVRLLSTIEIVRPTERDQALLDWLLDWLLEEPFGVR